MSRRNHRMNPSTKKETRMMEWRMTKKKKGEVMTTIAESPSARGDCTQEQVTFFAPPPGSEEP